MPSMHARAPQSAARSHTRLRKIGFVPFALTVCCAVALIGASTAGAAQAPVGLGTATSFAVLAGSGITNTGPTTITGDVGTFPTTSESGFGSVVLGGTDHGGDAVTQQAKTDLVAAYNDAAGRLPQTAHATELGGDTLLPGVYTNGTFGITGALTLDAQNDPNAVFVFQMSSTLVTEASSSVVMLNGVNPCNVFWQVGSSATLGTNSDFVGTVMALQSITLTTGAEVVGRMLARNGAVTMDSNVITNTGCATVPVTPSQSDTTTTVPGDSTAGGSGDAAGDGSGDTTGTDTGLTTGSGTPPTDITRQLAFTG